MELKFIKEAIKEAHKAFDLDEVPVGAVIVRDGQVISRAHNLKEQSNISTHHAEILAIEDACKKLNTWRLNDCEMYVTLEPCPMCAGAILQSRLKRLVFGAKDLKSGAVSSLYTLLEDSRLNHRAEVIGGVLENECSELISLFFKNKRLANAHSPKE